jgi:hypothetical protein
LVWLEGIAGLEWSALSRSDAASHLFLMISLCDQGPVTVRRFPSMTCGTGAAAILKRIVPAVRVRIDMVIFDAEFQIAIAMDTLGQAINGTGGLTTPARAVPRCFLRLV